MSRPRLEAIMAKQEHWLRYYDILRLADKSRHASQELQGPQSWITLTVAFLSDFGEEKVNSCRSLVQRDKLWSTTGYPIVVEHDRTMCFSRDKHLVPKTKLPLLRP